MYRFVALTDNDRGSEERRRWVSHAGLTHQSFSAGAYLSSSALCSASLRRFSSSGVSTGGSSLIVNLSILPVNLNGTNRQAIGNSLRLYFISSLGVSSGDVCVRKMSI